MMLETERLQLRPLSIEDIDGVLEIHSDPVAMRFSPTDVRDRQDTIAYLERAMHAYREHGHGFLAARLRDGGSYVGHAGLLEQTIDGNPETEIATGSSESTGARDWRPRPRSLAGTTR